jgi:hypothetical protein
MASTLTHEQPVTQSDQDPPKAQPVGDPTSVTAQRVVLGHRREQGLDCCPDGIYHFGFECAHYVGDLHLVVGWNAPRIKSGPSQRPVDGHLSARPLNAIVATWRPQQTDALPSASLFRRETYLEDGHWLCKPFEIE